MVTDAGTSTLLALAALPPTGTDAGTSTARLLAMTLAFSMRTRFPNIFRLLCYFTHSIVRHELERVCGSSLRCNFNTFFHGLEIELGMVLVWELHVRNGVSVLEHAGIPSGPVCLSMLSGVNVGPNYFTIILQSSVGRGEAHF